MRGGAGWYPAAGWQPACCVFTISLFLFLTACGYPGTPLPPALNRPLPVTDLSSVERGPNIVIHFTIPRITTEGLPVKGNPDVELRIGLADGFKQETWEHTADLIPVPAQNTPVAAVEVPASKYSGKTVVIGVNVHGPKGHTAGWSNFDVLPIVPALATPEGIEAQNAPDAVRLDWHAAAPEFRVYRKTPDDLDWKQIGTSNTQTYTDKTIEYGKTYQYFVQAAEKAGDKYAESEPSSTATIKPIDTFSPAAPSGLTAIIGARSIELAWERSPERDFASYRVYRDGQKIAENLTAPAYSDGSAQPGVKYRYQVSAIDNAGNESDRSAPIEASLP